jgi:hypothetical protein
MKPWQSMIEDYLEYLEKLKPSKQKSIAGSWKAGIEFIPKSYPQILGWTKRHEDAKLCIAGLFCTFPVIGPQTLIDVLASSIYEKELNHAINAPSVKALDRIIYVWSKDLKKIESIGINYEQLFLDLIYPTNRSKWRSQFALQTKEIEE